MRLMPLSYCCFYTIYKNHRGNCCGRSMKRVHREPDKLRRRGKSQRTTGGSGRESLASSRNASGTADATGRSECTSQNGPIHEATVRKETGWDQSPRKRETANCFSGEVSHTISAFAHARTNSTAFDVTNE